MGCSHTVHGISSPYDTGEVFGRMNSGNRQDIVKRLILLCNYIIGVDEIDENSNFFQIGGTSMMVLELSSRIYDEFGVYLSPDTIYKNAILDTMVRIIADRLAGVDTENDPEDPPDFCDPYTRG